MTEEKKQELREYAENQRTWFYANQMDGFPPRRHKNGELRLLFVHAAGVEELVFKQHEFLMLEIATAARPYGEVEIYSYGGREFVSDVDENDVLQWVGDWEHPSSQPFDGVLSCC